MCHCKVKYLQLKNKWEITLQRQIEKRSELEKAIFRHSTLKQAQRCIMAIMSINFGIISLSRHLYAACYRVSSPKNLTTTNIIYKEIVQQFKMKSQLFTNIIINLQHNNRIVPIYMIRLLYECVTYIGSTKSMKTIFAQ